MCWNEQIWFLNFPTLEPESLTIGDWWLLKRTDLRTDYTSVRSIFSFTARKRVSGSVSISITFSESDDDYLIEVPSATTASYNRGKYPWHTLPVAENLNESRLMKVNRISKAIMYTVPQIRETTMKRRTTIFKKNWNT